MNSIYILNKKLYDTVYPTARICKSRNQVIEVRVDCLTITPNTLLSEFLLSLSSELLCPGYICSRAIGRLWGLFLPGDKAVVPLNWQLNFIPGHYEIFSILNP